MPMLKVLRRVLVPMAALTVAATLAGTPAPPYDGELATGMPPINTAKVYRWGNAAWHDGFVGPLRSGWVRNAKAPLIQNQHGQLTLNGPGGDGRTLVATFPGWVRTYGRWETSFRTRQYETAHTPYRVAVELVPSEDDQEHCGAQTIQLATFRLGAKAAKFNARSLPDNEFSDSNAHPVNTRDFHTYAVEITKDRISWFMEGKVLMSERRDIALTGVKYKLRYRLIRTEGARMNKGRMQMDWARYYTLARPNAKSVAAPQGDLGTYDGAC